MTEAENWPAVGERLRARMSDLGLTKSELIERSGISFKTLSGYLDGEPIRRLDKRRDLAKALQWEADAIDVLLLGGEPKVADFEEITDRPFLEGIRDAIRAEVHDAMGHLGNKSLFDLLAMAVWLIEAQHFSEEGGEIDWHRLADFLEHGYGDMEHIQIAARRSVREGWTYSPVRIEGSLRDHIDKLVAATEVEPSEVALAASTGTEDPGDEGEVSKPSGAPADQDDA